MPLDGSPAYELPGELVVVDAASGVVMALPEATAALNEGDSVNTIRGISPHR